MGGFYLEVGSPLVGCVINGAKKVYITNMVSSNRSMVLNMKVWHPRAGAFFQLKPRPVGLQLVPSFFLFLMFTSQNSYQGQLAAQLLSKEISTAFFLLHITKNEVDNYLLLWTRTMCKYALVVELAGGRYVINKAAPSSYPNMQNTLKQFNVLFRCDEVFQKWYLHKSLNSWIKSCP